MRNNKIAAIVIGLIVCMGSIDWVMAAKNPIGSSLNRSFQSPVIVGRSYTITYTFKNNIPIKLVHALLIAKIALPADEFSYVDNCSNQKLTPGEKCTVQVTLTPQSAGSKFFQILIQGYDNNVVKLPQLVTTATGTVQDGISASTTQSLFYQMSQGTTGNYTFTYTNLGSIEATNVHSSVIQSDGVSATIITNTCMPGGSPGTIPNRASNGSCTISGTYHASTLGDQTVTGTITFDGASGNPASTQAVTRVVSPVDEGNVVGSLVTPDYLPPLMTQSTSYPTYFLFTNTSNAQVNFAGTNQGTVTCTDSHSVSCGTCSSTSCTGLLSDFSSSCNNFLPYSSPAAACEVQAKFNAPVATDPLTTYTVQASLAFSPDPGGHSPATVSTTGTVIATLPTTRTITLVNNCNFPVWFSLNGASVAGSCNAEGVGCSPGTSCDTTKGTCFWTNPSPNSPGGGTDYELAATTGTNTVTIPAYNYGGVQWSGNISASLGCDGTANCAQASCKNHGGSTSCKVGTGFNSPSTLAEFTMNVSSSDSYDVGTINGFHIPISVEPIYYTGIPATPNGYTCGTPGQYTSGNGFGACNWANVSLPSPSGGTDNSSGYYWVTKGGTSCNIANGSEQCGTGSSKQICGVAIDYDTDTLTTVCGDFMGYWTGDQICSYSNLPSSINTFFNCSTLVSSLSEASGLPFPSGATLYDLLSCAVPTNDPYPLYNSCYNSYSGSTSSEIETCCGCVDWWQSSETGGVTIDSNSNTQSCQSQTDPVWTTYIRPMVQWMKAACPSVYTYQFDDKSSGFSCSNNLPNDANSVGYTITFCQGNSGLPTDVAEGRE